MDALIFRAAIMRAPSPTLADGERTHVERVAVDQALAQRQHAALADALRGAGLAVDVLPALEGQPDACFVEDAALILPEASILTRPGAPSRAREPADIAPYLPPDRPVLALSRGRLDGGDVLWIGRTLYVGISGRTDGEGALALAELVRPLGYRINTIPIGRSLHLKTAMTRVAADIVAINRSWLPGPPPGLQLAEVAPGEPFGANWLWVNARLIGQASAPVTAERMAAGGLVSQLIDISEFQKAEAGLTCLCLLVPERG